MYFFFEEKAFSSFKIASLPKWEGAKNAGGSRPSCLFFCTPLTDQGIFITYKMQLWSGNNPEKLWKQKRINIENYFDW